MTAKTSSIEKNLLLISFMALYLELKKDNLFIFKNLCEIDHIVRVGREDPIVVLVVWRLEKKHLNHLFGDFFFFFFFFSPD